MAVFGQRGTVYEITDAGQRFAEKLLAMIHQFSKENCVLTELASAKVEAYRGSELADVRVVMKFKVCPDREKK